MSIILFIFNTFPTINYALGPLTASKTFPTLRLSISIFVASVISSMHQTESIFGKILPSFMNSKSPFSIIRTFSSFLLINVPKCIPQTAILFITRSAGFMYFVCHHIFIKSNKDSFCSFFMKLLIPTKCLIATKMETNQQLA